VGNDGECFIRMLVPELGCDKIGSGQTFVSR